MRATAALVKESDGADFFTDEPEQHSYFDEGNDDILGVRSRPGIQVLHH